jgi:hypothetical protein
VRSGELVAEQPVAPVVAPRPIEQLALAALASEAHVELAAVPAAQPVPVEIPRVAG